jgi:hypothetical protein
MVCNIHFMAYAVLILATSIWVTFLYRDFNKKIEEEEVDENE